MPVHSKIEEGIGQIILDQPPLNILTQELLGGVRDALEMLAAQETLRVMVLHATGKHFSAGASVEEHLPPHVDDMIPEFMETIATVRSFPLPTIAAVHGRCLGGAFELAVATDLIVASESAHFGVPEIQLGVFPPAACAFLPAIVPPALAAELIFTGDTVDARTLADAGLVRRVAPDGELLDTAFGLAGRIARHSAASLRATKRALQIGLEPAADTDDRVTRIYLDELMRTHDASEGLASFVDKRKPEWSHR